MPLGKKWRSMDVLHFGSSKQDKENLKKAKAFHGSRENLSRSVGPRPPSRSREDLLFDHNHNDRSRTSARLSRDLRLRLGSLSNVKEDQGSPKRDEGGGGDKEGVGYIQRCVIIQRDEKGYGLTVRGDNPVYVESVKPDGAAARAGVQQGDRICKVNGTLVTNSNHIEVVKLIKSGAFVALTLMNKVQNTPTDRPPGDTSGGAQFRNKGVTAPIPVDERKSQELKHAKLNEIKKYYDIAVEDLQVSRQKYQNNPSEKLLTTINEQERTVKKLEEQLKSQSPHSHQSETVPDFAQLDPSAVAPWGMSMPTQVSDGSSMSDSPNTSPNTSPTPTHPNNTHDAETNIGKRNSNYDDISQNSQVSNSKVQPNIIAMEDDEFVSDEEQTMMNNERKLSAPTVSPFLARLQTAESDDHGPFSNLQILEKKPAHMAVFLNYVMQYADPSSLLFYITSHIYHQAKGSTKELQKWAYEIHSTFLASGAPLKVSVDDIIIIEIDKILVTKPEKEESLRGIFSHARNAAQNEVQTLLQEFCSKREIGFWALYGAQDLKDNMRQKEEYEIMNRVLTPHLEKALQSDEDVKPDKDIAVCWAIATFLRHVGYGDKKHTPALERVQSFVAKDRKSITSKLGQSQKKKTHKGHTFQLQHFSRVENCAHCSNLIWGVGHQGYQCSSCEICVHKQCIDELEDNCHKKKRRPASAVLPGFRRPQVPTVPEKEASSPGPGSVVPVQPFSNEDDDDKIKSTRDISVPSLVSIFNNIGPPQDRKKTPVNEEATGKKGTEIGRSESLKGRHDQKGGRPTRRAKSDVDMDESTLRAINNSGSSSSSSIRSGESPSNSMDAVNNIPQSLENDSDFDVTPELPPLDSILPKEVYKKLKPKEKKRQEVINELCYTERTHVRNLKALLNVFYIPMAHDPNISQDLIKLLFPNLEDLITLHGSLNNAMKARRKENPVVSEVGDLLLNRFDGEEGEAFRSGCAIFCRNQSYALDALRSRQKKDARLANFLMEAETSNLLRRLQLRDLIPTQMMRLTKYPLLIENLLRYTPTSNEEYGRLEKALQFSKHILEYVNQAVKECENLYKLQQLQRKVDKRQIESDAEDLRNLDLTKHKMVYEGSLTWNINQRKTVDVHVVLLEDQLVLFQKQDDKLVLKCQSTQLVAGKEDSRYMFSPLLDLKNILHTNSKATDKKTFFVVSKSQIYELSAHTAEEQRKWIKYIKEAADTCKRQDKDVLPPTPQVLAEGKDQIHSIRRPSAESKTNLHPEVDITQEPVLIQPEEVTIHDPMTVKSEPILTPLEKMRRLDETLKEHIQDKILLVAQVLDIPVSEIPTRVKLAEAADPSMTPSDLILAALQESGECLSQLNAAESGLAEEDLKLPIPMDKLKEMANRMNQILTNLLAVMSSRDDERERLRQELKAAQDELNMLRDIQRRVSASSPGVQLTQERPLSFVSEASSSVSDNDEVAQNTAEEGEETPEGQPDQTEIDQEVPNTAPQQQTENDVEDDVDDTDSEYSETEVSTATELPREMTDIPTETLTEIEPPEEDTLEEEEPPSATEEELLNADQEVQEVQEAEINQISDLMEQVTEINIEKDSIETQQTEETSVDKKSDKVSSESEEETKLENVEQSEDVQNGTAESADQSCDKDKNSDECQDDSKSEDKLSDEKVDEGVEKNVSNSDNSDHEKEIKDDFEERTDVGSEKGVIDIIATDYQASEEGKIKETDEVKILNPDNNDNVIESTNTDESTT